MQGGPAIPRVCLPQQGTFTLALALLCVLAVGCDSVTSSPRPSASLVDVEFTPQPTPTGEATATDTTEPTFVSLPVGWDDDFCAVFDDVFVAQELVIDVERALGEQNTRDAKALARELRDTATHGNALLSNLADWGPGQQAALEMATLLDLGGRAGDEYGTFFATDSRTALRHARGLRSDIRTKTPRANAALTDLAQTGINCPDHELVLESP